MRLHIYGPCPPHHNLQSAVVGIKLLTSGPPCGLPTPPHQTVTRHLLEPPYYFLQMILSSPCPITYHHQTYPFFHYHLWLVEAHPQCCSLIGWSTLAMLQFVWLEHTRNAAVWLIRAYPQWCSVIGWSTPACWNLIDRRKRGESKLCNW